MPNRVSTVAWAQLRAQRSDEFRVERRGVRRCVGNEPPGSRNGPSDPGGAGRNVLGWLAIGFDDPEPSHASKERTMAKSKKSDKKSKKSDKKSKKADKKSAKKAKKADKKSKKSAKKADKKREKKSKKN